MTDKTPKMSSGSWIPFGKVIVSTYNEDVPKSPNTTQMH